VSLQELRAPRYMTCKRYEGDAPSPKLRAEDVRLGRMPPRRSLEHRLRSERLLVYGPRSQEWSLMGRHRPSPLRICHFFMGVGGRLPVRPPNKWPFLGVAWPISQLRPPETVIYLGIVGGDPLEWPFLGVDGRIPLFRPPEMATFAAQTPRWPF